MCHPRTETALFGRGRCRAGRFTTRKAASGRLSGSSIGGAYQDLPCTPDPMPPLPGCSPAPPTALSFPGLPRPASDVFDRPLPLPLLLPEFEATVSSGLVLALFPPDWPPDGPPVWSIPAFWPVSLPFPDDPLPPKLAFRLAGTSLIPSSALSMLRRVSAGHSLSARPGKMSLRFNATQQASKFRLVTGWQDSKVSFGRCCCASAADPMTAAAAAAVRIGTIFMFLSFAFLKGTSGVTRGPKQSFEVVRGLAYRGLQAKKECIHDSGLHSMTLS